ncbi:glycoside hydrolase family 18 and carbohydrate-binding module family 5 protein [Rhizoctonia solani AG-1 IA]|uniref:chitinase n=1 Tax=Thanatephorus cucumeris (strain AG1-IA) TaxID=983506 RepID=L8WPA2_THACA|nr:glycoside hydrolase family 18 and carbohydrate-binding module family 5 protein [Rhizoctonia solani AG-1 IA]
MPAAPRQQHEKCYSMGVKFRTHQGTNRQRKKNATNPSPIDRAGLGRGFLRPPASLIWQLYRRLIYNSSPSQPLDLLNLISIKQHSADARPTGILLALFPVVISREREEPWQFKAHVVLVNLLALGQTIISSMPVFTGSSDITGHNTGIRAVGKFPASVSSSSVQRASYYICPRLLHPEMLENTWPPMDVYCALSSSMAVDIRFQPCNGHLEKINQQRWGIRAYCHEPQAAAVPPMALTIAVIIDGYLVGSDHGVATLLTDLSGYVRQKLSEVNIGRMSSGGTGPTRSGHNEFAAIRTRSVRYQNQMLSGEVVTVQLDDLGTSTNRFTREGDNHESDGEAAPSQDDKSLAPGVPYFFRNIPKLDRLRCLFSRPSKMFERFVRLPNHVSINTMGDDVFQACQRSGRIGIVKTRFCATFAPSGGTKRLYAKLVAIHSVKVFEGLEGIGNSSRHPCLPTQANSKQPSNLLNILSAAGGVGRYACPRLMSGNLIKLGWVPSQNMGVCPSFSLQRALALLRRPPPHLTQVQPAFDPQLHLPTGPGPLRLCLNFYATLRLFCISLSDPPYLTKSLVTVASAMPLPGGFRAPHILAKRAISPGTCRVRPRSKITAAPGGKVNVGYFTNWGVYDAQNITTDTITHILYAFGDCDGQTGMAKLSDTYSDQQIVFLYIPPVDGDTWDESGNNLYQLYALKLKHRTIKVLLSIGGWTYSQAGHFDFVTSASARATFVNSSIALMEDNGLDGIDIDYEYPETPEQASGFVSLLSEMRTALDAHAAVPAGAANYQNLLASDMNKYLTMWNLMAYDYAGAWSSVSDDQANLYGGSGSGSSTDTAISWYTSNGVPANKIALGIPLYGRSFQNTAGIHQSYSGVGTGSAESGIYDYKALPPDGSEVVENTTMVSSYSYNPSTKELVSYDTPTIAKMKAQYIAKKGLAGGKFDRLPCCKLSGDKTGSDSLVRITAQNMGSLDNTPNHIYYPYSQFDNIKKNLGQGGASASPTYVPPTSTSTSTRPTASSTTTRSTTATPTTSSSPVTTTITSGAPSTTVSATDATTSPVWTPTPQPGNLCDALRLWDSEKAYTRGDVVRYLDWTIGYIWASIGDNTAQIPSGVNRRKLSSMQCPVKLLFEFQVRKGYLACVTIFTDNHVLDTLHALNRSMSLVPRMTSSE